MILDTPLSIQRGRKCRPCRSISTVQSWTTRSLQDIKTQDSILLSEGAWSCILTSLDLRYKGRCFDEHLKQRAWAALDAQRMERLLMALPHSNRITVIYLKNSPPWVGGGTACWKAFEAIFYFVERRTFLMGKKAHLKVVIWMLYAQTV